MQKKNIDYSTNISETDKREKLIPIIKMRYEISRVNAECFSK